MRKYTASFMLILLAIVSSCSEEEASMRLSNFEIPVITGHFLKGASGTSYGTNGIPNVKVREVTPTGSVYSFNVFPNPCSELCRIDIQVPGSGILKKIWIIPAQYEGNNQSTINNLGATTMILGGEPVFEAEFSIDETTLDLSGLDSGYYRIYLQADNYLLYDNLVIL